MSNLERPEQPYSRRKAKGLAWEGEMQQIFVDKGYEVIPYVRGQYSGWSQWRDEQKRRSPTEWFADFALRNPNGQFFFAEAKSTLEENAVTENFTVEISSVEAQKKLVNLEEKPVFFVFSNKTVCDPCIIEEHGQAKDGIDTGRTPYYIFRRNRCIAFDEVFGDTREAHIRLKSGYTNIFERWLLARSYSRVEKTNRFIHSLFEAVELLPNRASATQAKIMVSKNKTRIVDSLQQLEHELNNGKIFKLSIRSPSS